MASHKPYAACAAPDAGQNPGPLIGQSKPPLRGPVSALCDTDRFNEAAGALHVVAGSGRVARGRPLAPSVEIVLAQAFVDRRGEQHVAESGGGGKKDKEGR